MCYLSNNFHLSRPTCSPPSPHPLLPTSYMPPLHIPLSYPHLYYQGESYTLLVHHIIHNNLLHFHGVISHYLSSWLPDTLPFSSLAINRITFHDSLHGCLQYLPLSIAVFPPSLPSFMAVSSIPLHFMAANPFP